MGESPLRRAILVRSWAPLSAAAPWAMLDWLAAPPPVAFWLVVAVLVAALVALVFVPWSAGAIFQPAAALSRA